MADSRPGAPILARPLALLSLTLGTAAAAAEPCELETTAQQVQEAADAALLALDDAEAFAARVVVVDRTVECLRAEADFPALAAAHRILGLHAFRDGDETRARQAFRAARKLQPAFAWPDSVLPAEDPARVAYERVNADSSTEPVPEPAAGRLIFDGVPELERPTARATVFQRVDGAGSHVDAAYVWPGEPLPAYPLPPPPDPGIKRRRTALFAGAGGAAITSVVLYGLAASAASTYADPTTPYADGPGLRSRANGLVVGSALTGTAAVGLGVGALLQGKL